VTSASIDRHLNAGASANSSTAPAGTRPPEATWPEALLSRVEDAGLNASAPPQQRWIDGWLVRFSPGKAKRARCINAVAEGRLPLAERLAECETLYRDKRLPMFVRVTPFSRPQGLDHRLGEAGFVAVDDTRVMVAAAGWPAAERLPPHVELQRLALADFAEAVGGLRGSPADQRVAHAERLACLPVACEGWVLRSRDDGVVLACGQAAVEGRLVGLYDVVTASAHRGQGLARQLCSQLLAGAAQVGATVAYLQVDADNAPARAIYQRLGFVDAYGYHYRCRPADAA